MSATGLEVFDKTLQMTHTWLNEIGEHEAVGSDRQRAYHALRAVLFTVRDRMTVEEAFDLSAHLPMLVRGIFWESYRPAHKPERYRSREEFLARVSEHLKTSPMEPGGAAQAVFAVLERHVPEGELAHVRQMLPEPVRGLFRAA